MNSYSIEEMKMHCLKKKEQKIKEIMKEEREEKINTELRKLNKDSYKPHRKVMMIIRDNLLLFFSIEKDREKRYILLKTIKNKQGKKKEEINK